MLRLVPPSPGPAPDEQTEMALRVMTRAVGAMLETHIGALTARITVLERRVETLETELRRAPTGITAHRLRGATLPAPILEDVIRRLDEGIDLHVIADGLGIGPAVLGMQLATVAEQRRSRRGGGVTPGE